MKINFPSRPLGEIREFVMSDRAGKVVARWKVDCFGRTIEDSIEEFDVDIYGVTEDGES